MKIAVYPGSFDPMTNGHIDLIRRGTELFDQIIVGVLENEDKKPLFKTEDRVAMVREALRDLPSVRVQSFTGLLVNFMKTTHANVVVRGLRAVSDFEYEFQMALMNRELSPIVETIFMMPAVEYTYVSSRLVKEVCRLGGDVTRLVPSNVLVKLHARFGAPA